MASSTSFTNTSLGPVTLPLFKLSHCTINSPGAHMLWTHLPNRDDMFAVFDKARSKGLGGNITTKQVLKLIRGGELLETVDFDSLQNQARMDRERAQSQAISDDLLYVIIVVKPPLLALRYRLPDGKIRRLQMNFQPTSGCDTALEILQPLGLPVRNKQVSEPSRPVLNRPYSAQSAMTTSSSRTQESRGTLTAAFDDAPPPSAQPGRDYTRPAHLPDGNHPDTFSKPISYNDDPRTRPVSGGGATHNYNPLSRPYSSSDAFGLTDQTTMKPPPYRRLLPSPALGSQPSFVSGSDDYRPISAPDPQTLNYPIDGVSISQMLPPLPPVRELPWLTGRETHSATRSAAESPLGMPVDHEAPKPKKKRAPAKPKASTTKARANAPGPKARTKKLAASTAGTDGIPPSSAPPNGRQAIHEALDEVPPSSAPPNMALTLEALEKTVSKMSKQFTPPSSRGNTEGSKKRPLSAIDDNEINKRQPVALGKENLLDILPTEAQKSNLVLSNINPAEFLDSLDGWIRTYHDLPAPKAPMTSKDQLAEYASKDDEERHRIIDNMICECLRSEDFGKLCDDVEGHWKRIFLL